MVEEHSSLRLSTVLVNGGSGGLASQILRLFSQRGFKSLHSIDLRKPSHPLDGVICHVGDFTDVEAMRLIFHEVKPDVVIHTASPRFDSPSHILYKVNVEGTKDLVEIANESGTHSFVYISSVNVISAAKTDLKNADETFPVIFGDQQPDFYVHTKTLAETYARSQNRRSADASPHFPTCAIQPSRVFGFGDLAVHPGILDIYFRDRTKVEIGDNKKLFDFTESTKAAYDSYLAVAVLVESQKSLPGIDTKVDGEVFFHH